jgi:dTDP-4-dehydrorhamnose 3,5-epimerase
MQNNTLSLQGIIVFEPAIFPGERGEFFESFNQRMFQEATGQTLNDPLPFARQ